MGCHNTRATACGADDSDLVMGRGTLLCVSDVSLHRPSRMLTPVVAVVGRPKPTEQTQPVRIGAAPTTGTPPCQLDCPKCVRYRIRRRSKCGDKVFESEDFFLVSIACLIPSVRRFHYPTPYLTNYYFDVESSQAYHCSLLQPFTTIWVPALAPPPIYL